LAGEAKSGLLPSVLSTRRPLRHSFADQRGQDAVEYLGTLAIVAVLITSVTLAVQTLGPQILQGAECLVAKVFGTGCGSSPGSAYPVSSSTKTAGYDARVVAVNGSHGYTITLTKYSDGTSTVTATNTGKLGVSAEVGAGIEAGPLGGADASASIQGGGYGDQVNTWKFPSWSLGQKNFDKIAGGNSLGLTAHDAVSSTVGSLPWVGSHITSGFDDLTGASGAPGQGSLPHKYLASSSTGVGLQGSADGEAGVDLGALQAGASASLDAQAGVERITYGPDKGGYQLRGGLDGNATGDLGSALFGAQADGAGNLTGDLSVTFSPSGAPQKLELSASGDGVWGVSPPTDAKVNIPGGSGSSGGGDKSGGEGGKEPVLSLKTEGSDGSGVGTVFTGELDLSSDPTAASDVTAILQGDTSRLGDLINQMNSNGTETVQTYRISRSTSKVGVKGSVGVGFGGGLNDGNSDTTYNRPQIREHGGPWHEAP
jgi:hypothetical protein